MNTGRTQSFKRFKISELCELTKGSCPTLRTQPGDFPMVVTADFRRSADGWDIAGPAVCIPLISSTGHGDAAINRVHYQEGKFALANLLVALTPKKDAPVIAKYLYFLLGAEKDKLLVPLMMGTANVSLKPKDIADVEIDLPPIADQQKIVDLIDTAQQQLQAAAKLRLSIDREIASLLAVRFKETLTQATWLPMREVAPLVRRNVLLEPNRQFKELGARSFGKGLFVKADFDADAATWEKPVWIKSGDIVFSNIKAWEGAIGVAKPEHDGYIASHRYLTAVVKPEIAIPEYLLYYVLSEAGLTAVNEASPGTADRNRTTKQSSLEAIRVPVPPIAIQRQFVNLKNTIEKAAAIRAKQMVSVEAMLPALCHQVLS